MWDMGRSALEGRAPTQTATQGWSLRTAPGRKTTLETLMILQDHFPERLGSAVCLNPPRMFSAFFAARPGARKNASKQASTLGVPA